jgi:ethanolamine-phosphate cytidylyltransferase
MAEYSFSKESLFLFVAHASHYIHSNPELDHMIDLYFQTPREPNVLFESLKAELAFNVTSEMHRVDPLRMIECAADPTRIYIDGCFDIMHSGHFNAIRQAKMLGRTLVVGIHNDEEIARNKGTPIMNDSERIAMVHACKWVDEVVLNAPYSPTIDWINRFNCMYIAHGDDIAINSEGRDAYGELKACGRFKVIKRTEGISTTSLVGKLLLMTNDQPAPSVEVPTFASEYTESQRHFLTTSRRISEFSNGVKPTPEARIVYIDGAFDLFRKS